MASAPDRRRWGDAESYLPGWNERARLAASLLPDNVSVLEIGVGTGFFRDLVGDRAAYTGADLQPLDARSIALDLDRDPLPEGPFDYAVLLGVFEYLHCPEAAARKICEAADRIIISYCFRQCAAGPETRVRRGWVNDLDRTEFTKLFSRHGYEVTAEHRFNTNDEFEQIVMEFRRCV